VGFPVADRGLRTTFPLKECLENQAIDTSLGLEQLRGKVLLLILKTSYRFPVHVHRNRVQIVGAKIGHYQAADKLAEERVDVKDTAYPSDDDRCRGGDRQWEEGKGGHHNTGSAVIDRHFI
jgi:hypothetical protein